LFLSCETTDNYTALLLKKIHLLFHDLLLNELNQHRVGTVHTIIQSTYKHTFHQIL
jgi:hypothetical protein